MIDMWSISILKDKKFELSRKVLNGKAIYLRRIGIGKRSGKFDSQTEEEEEILWKTVLGKENPTSLKYTLFFSSSLNISEREVTKNITRSELKISRPSMILKLKKSLQLSGLKGQQKPDSQVGQ